MVDESSKAPVLYLFELKIDATAAGYDEAMVVACLQGIINREKPRLYVTSATNGHPTYWLDTLSKERDDLSARPRTTLSSLEDLIKLAGDDLRGVVIWDPDVPATVNVATTIAGVESAVVLSPDMADLYLTAWNLPIIEDLRGRFDGHETGSRKNDAYRWAIRTYLAKGLCSSHILCLFEDASTQRKSGGIGYVLTRDWAVFNRAFVFDLSPWGDETPKDDPGQKLGTDLETYHMILKEVMAQADGNT